MFAGKPFSIASIEKWWSRPRVASGVVDSAEVGGVTTRRASTSTYAWYWATSTAIFRPEREYLECPPGWIAPLTREIRLLAAAMNVGTRGHIVRRRKIRSCDAVPRMHRAVVQSYFVTAGVDPRVPPNSSLREQLELFDEAPLRYVAEDMPERRRRNVGGEYGITRRRQLAVPRHSPRYPRRLAL